MPARFRRSSAPKQKSARRGRSGDQLSGADNVRFRRARQPASVPRCRFTCWFGTGFLRFVDPDGEQRQRSELPTPAERADLTGGSGWAARRSPAQRRDGQSAGRRAFYPGLTGLAKRRCGPREHADRGGLEPAARERRDRDLNRLGGVVGAPISSPRVSHAGDDANSGDACRSSLPSTRHAGSSRRRSAQSAGQARRSRLPAR